MMPKLIISETILETRVFDVRRDTIAENGREYVRDIVVHRGSAVIVPLFNDGTVGLVRQYRHAAGEYLLELPAGSLEKDEDPETAAGRELEEEIGYRANSIRKIAEFYVSPGFLTEKMFVFLATDLVETAQNLDDDEFVEIERHSVDQLLAMVGDGSIMDAKTIIGVSSAFSSSK